MKEVIIVALVFGAIYGIWLGLSETGFLPNSMRISSEYGALLRGH